MLKHSSIKWLRLKEILKEIIGKEVDLHGSTSLLGDEVASVDSNGDVHIAINLSKVKGIEDIIEVVAHEAAHAVLGVEKHSEAFWTTKRGLEKDITKKYFKEE